jgi:hypothetical protein
MDPTEDARRDLTRAVNAVQGSREALEARYGRVWSTEELTADYEVVGFLAPFVSVRRKADGVRGTLMFQHSPRFYFSFET